MVKNHHGFRIAIILFAVAILGVAAFSGLSIWNKAYTKQAALSNMSYVNDLVTKYQKVIAQTQTVAGSSAVQHRCYYYERGDFNKGPLWCFTSQAYYVIAHHPLSFSIASDIIQVTRQFFSAQGYTGTIANPTSSIRGVPAVNIITAANRYALSNRAAHQSDCFINYTDPAYESQPDTIVTPAQFAKTISIELSCGVRTRLALYPVNAN